MVYASLENSRQTQEISWARSLGMVLVRCLVVEAVLFGVVMIIHPDPAYAVFLSDAQAKAKAALGGTSSGSEIKTTIDLVFNILRVVVFIGVAFGVFQTVQAQREGGDWKSSLGLPLSLVGGVAVIDLITPVIFP